jgi:hypothetical protein
MASGIYPNMKEYTEAAACYNAVRTHVCGSALDLTDPNVLLVAVGDGSSPRVAALFAMRSAWECISVDPALRPLAPRVSIERLRLLRARIEDVELGEVDRPAVLVACHAHVDLRVARRRVRSRQLAVVAMPCCVELTLDLAPDEDYVDVGCWSPERQIKVWRLSEADVT